jgi:predicted RNA-binding protein with PUA-like domain
MTYWLIKSEPEEYSYLRLEQEEKVVWDGVKNALALINMRQMVSGDLAFFYHTGTQRQIVGIVQMISAAYPDPALSDPKRVVVDLVPVRRLAKPVKLAEIKQDSAFAGFDLVRMSRLSVMPVSEAYWQRILQLAGEV